MSAILSCHGRRDHILLLAVEGTCFTCGAHLTAGKPEDLEIVMAWLVAHKSTHDGNVSRDRA